MRLSLAIATLALAVTTALPASAATPSAPILASLQNAVPAPVEVVANRQGTRQQRQTRSNRTYRGGYSGAYRGGYNAYARDAASAPYGTGRPRYQTPWGQCVNSLDRGARSAFPNWDLC